MSAVRAPSVPWWQYAAVAVAGLGSLALIGYITRDESGETYSDQERKKRTNARAAAASGQRAAAPTKQTTEERLRTILGLAEQARRDGEYSKAEGHFMEALQLIATDFGPEHILNALAQQALCNVYVAQKKWAAGEQSLRLAKQIMAKNNVPPAQYAEVDSLLAEILVSLAKLDEAEQLIMSSLRGFDSWPADEETDAAVAQSLLTLGQIKARKRQFDAARASCQQALDRVLKSGAPTDPMALQCQMQLADVLLLMGEHAQAKALFDRLIEEQVRIAGGVETVKAGLLLNMIFTRLFERECFVDAEPYLRRAVAVFANHRTTREHRQVGISVGLDLVSCLQELGRSEEADTLLEELRKEADGEAFALPLSLSRTLRTTEASVTINFDAVYYLLKLEIKQNQYAEGGPLVLLPEGALVEAVFDNPVEPSSPYTVSIVVDANACRTRSLLLRSPPLLKFGREHEERALLVRLRVYADESKSEKPIAEHYQLSRCAFS